MTSPHRGERHDRTRSSPTCSFIIRGSSTPHDISASLITTVAQSVLDFAAAAPLDRVRYALAEADYRDLLDLQAVEEVLGRAGPAADCSARR